MAQDATNALVRVRLAQQQSRAHPFARPPEPKLRTGSYISGGAVTTYGCREIIGLDIGPSSRALYDRTRSGTKMPLVVAPSFCSPPARYSG